MDPIAIDERLLRPMPLMTGMDETRPGARYRRPQGLEEYSLILTVGGSATVGSAARKFEQRAGDLLLIEPRHASDQDTPRSGGWKRIWLIFAPRPHWRAWLKWPALAPGYRRLRLDGPAAASVRGHLEAMHGWAHSAGRLRHGRAMHALEAALLDCDGHNPEGDRAGTDPRVLAAIEFIAANLHRPLRLDDIAGAASVSVPHLNRLFRRLVAASPIVFAERQRMRRAAELLTMGGGSIADVAARVGFENPLYFSTRFKKYAGLSPRAFVRAGALPRAEDSATLR